MPDTKLHSSSPSSLQVSAYGQPGREIIGLKLQCKSESTIKSFMRSCQKVIPLRRRIQDNRIDHHDASYSSPIMSRDHARIVFEDSGRVYIEDRHSYNGTVVRSGELEHNISGGKRRQLKNGDILILGKPRLKDTVWYHPLEITVFFIIKPQTYSAPLSFESESESELDIVLPFRSNCFPSTSPDIDRKTDFPEAESDTREEIPIKPVHSSAYQDSESGPAKVSYPTHQPVKRIKLCHIMEELQEIKSSFSKEVINTDHIKPEEMMLDLISDFRKLEEKIANDQKQQLELIRSLFQHSTTMNTQVEIRGGKRRSEEVDHDGNLSLATSFDSSPYPVTKSFEIAPRHSYIRSAISTVGTASLGAVVMWIALASF